MNGRPDMLAWGLVTALLSVILASCDLSGLSTEDRFRLEEDLSYSYSALDSTGFEVVRGSLKFKFDFRSWGCSSDKCADITGTWDFTARVTPPTIPHPVGSGRVGGILTKEWRPRMTIGPDSRNNSVVLEFPIPPESEMTGTWTSPSGAGGVATFREK